MGSQRKGSPVISCKVIPTCTWQVRASDQVYGYLAMTVLGRAASCSSLVSQWTSGRSAPWKDPSGDPPHATRVSLATALAGKLACGPSVDHLDGVPVVMVVRADPLLTANYATNLCVSMQMNG